MFKITISCFYKMKILTIVIILIIRGMIVTQYHRKVFNHAVYIIYMVSVASTKSTSGTCGRSMDVFM
jgi:hypothetical protein